MHASLPTSGCRISVGRVFVLLAFFVCRVDAQLVQPSPPPVSYKSQPDMFLHRFAMDLLKKAHEDIPERNVVIAPLPVSLIFAAIWDGTQAVESAKEFRAVFLWFAKTSYDQNLVFVTMLQAFQ